MFDPICQVALLFDRTFGHFWTILTEYALRSKVDMNKDLSTNASGTLGAALNCGFAAATIVWTAWFITHSPWLHLPENQSVIALVCIWFVSLVAASRGSGSGWKAGLLGGLIAAAVGLLLLGTKLTEAPAGGGASSGLKPNAGLMVLGFLVLGAILGLVAGVVAQAIRGTSKTQPDWLARFAVVSVAAVAPLLFVGGLVTSNNAGMAVPDWPNTYGSNMFLYAQIGRAHV